MSCGSDPLNANRLEGSKVMEESIAALLLSSMNQVNHDRESIGGIPMQLTKQDIPIEIARSNRAGLNSVRSEIELALGSRASWISERGEMVANTRASTKEDSKNESEAKLPCFGLRSSCDSGGLTTNSRASGSNEWAEDRKMSPINMVNRNSISGYISTATTTEGISESDTNQSPKSAKLSRASKSGNPATGKIARGRPTYQMDRELLPAPYFYYRDHSQDIDDDPLSPLSPPLCVPNFVTKLYAILIREDLKEVVTFLPHGRAWIIIDTEAFEKRVLPDYFKQSNISSFHRQANGWGFRRILKGSDKGSFYNERFLRGFSFLCKKMKRIGGAKVFEDANISHEPNFWDISSEYPLPENPKNDSNYIMLVTINDRIKKEGPKAKMPSIVDIKHHDPLSSRVGSSLSKMVNEGGTRSGSTLSAEIINRETSVPNSSSHETDKQNEPGGRRDSKIQEESRPSEKLIDLLNISQQRLNSGQPEIGLQRLEPAQLHQLIQFSAQNQLQTSQGPQVQDLNMAQNGNEQMASNLFNVPQGIGQTVPVQNAIDQNQREIKQIAQIILQKKQERQLQNQCQQVQSLQPTMNQQMQQGILPSNLLDLQRSNPGQQIAQNLLQDQLVFLRSQSNFIGELLHQQSNTNHSAAAPAPALFAVTNPCSHIVSSCLAMQSNSNARPPNGSQPSVEDQLKSSLENIQPNHTRSRLSVDSVLDILQTKQESLQQNTTRRHSVEPVLGTLQHFNPSNPGGNRQDHSVQILNRLNQPLQDYRGAPHNVGRFQHQVATQTHQQQNVQNQFSHVERATSNVDQVSSVLQLRGGIPIQNHSQQNGYYSLAGEALLAGIHLGIENVGNTGHSLLQQKYG